MNSPIIAPLLAGTTIGSPQSGFIVAEWRDRGGPVGERRYIAPIHLHHHEDELWYVLEGALIVQAGDIEVEAHGGAAVMVPRGTPHTFWNPGPGPVRYLLIMMPETYRLIQALHATTDRSPSFLRALFRKHGAELL